MNQSQTLPLIAVLAGFVLLYGAIRNRNPLQVVKNSITNKPLTGAKKIQ